LTADKPAYTRRNLLWLSLAFAGSIVVAGELQKPNPVRWKLPECEPLPNPWSPAFSSAFGPGVGMACPIVDLPASPKAVFRDNSVTIEGPDLPRRL
jgi:hypothetical protein